MYARFFAPDRDKGGASVVHGVQRWLRERESSRPYFLFVNLMEAHAPYQEVGREHRLRFTSSPLTLREAERVGTWAWFAQWAGVPLPSEIAERNLELMDGAISAADAYLGEVLDAIGSDALVLVLADHGDLVGEHGLAGHNGELYEPLIRIPMIVAGPGVPEGARIGDLGSILDVAPTLLGVTGVRGPDLPGRDLWPLIQGRAAWPDRAVQAEHFRTSALAARGWYAFRPADEVRRVGSRKAVAVAAKRKRLVTEDGRDVAFDLESDPGENAPQPVGDPSIEVSVPSLRTDLAPVGSLDPFTHAALAALGYSE
jgi:arylsulfatase A-like enzyme